MLSFFKITAQALLTMTVLIVLNGCNPGGGGSGSFIDSGYVDSDIVPEVSFNLDSINRLNVSNFVISGTCTQGSELIISDGTNTYSANCDDGSFELTEDLSSLLDGSITFSCDVTLGNLSSSTSLVVTKDTTGGPTGISITGGSYSLNSNFNIEITFSSKVTVDSSSGTPSIDLLVGGSTKTIFYSSGSGTSTLVFSGTVQSGEEDTDGLSLQANSISRNGGTIQVAGIDSLLDLSGGSNNLSGATLYGILPTVSISSAPNITLANQTSYSAIGSCSDDGQNVEINVGTLTLNRTCTGGAWTTGNIDVSGEADDNLFSITAVHSDAGGNNSTTASVSIDKTTSVPVVTLNTPSAISSANVSSYSLSGTCSENGRVVSVSLGALNFTPNCASGFWNTGNQIVSSLADNPSISITVDHQNAGGANASQVSTTVSKDLSLPTVTISSPTNINVANQTSYSVGGTCSENGRTVSVILGGINLTPTCTGGTWYSSGVNVSAIGDSSNVSITADHDNAGGTNATQATATVSKETSTPSVSNLGTSDELVNSISLSWILENGSGFTINDFVIQYRVKSTSVWLTFSDGTSTNTASTVTGLNPSTVYEFRVRVTYNTSSTSSYSEIAEGETKPNSPIFGVNKAMNVGGATESRVVAFEDDTDVTLNGSSLITLQRGETHIFTSSQFDIIDANKPIFTAGKRGPNNAGANGANIVWQPVLWAGKAFSFNAIRSNPQALLVYPIESGTITVKQGTNTLASANITQGVGASLSWSTYGSYQVSSTANVLLFHYSASGSQFTDPKPILPSSKKIIGFPSTRMILTSDLDGTNYTGVHSNSVTVNNNLDANDSVQVNSQGTSSLFQGESFVISGDKELSGASFADSNGSCAAPFLPTSFMKNGYAINANSDYVAFASLQSGIIKVYDSNDNLLEAVALVRSGSSSTAPYRARFANQNAGTRYISTVPMAGWYQPNEYNGAMRSDETILYGSTVSDPGTSFTAPTNPITCKTLKDGNSSLTDGVYSIDPDGDGGASSFSAYCDMTTQGGGWTLVIKYDRDQATAGNYALPSGTGRSAINISDLQDLNVSGNLASSQDIRPFIKGGATHFMHVTTAPGSSSYTHTYFSDIYISTRILPDNLFDPNLDTNDAEAISGSAGAWSSGSGTNWYESDFSLMSNSQTSGSVGSANTAIFGGEGNAMWTNGSREGAVYSSGVSTAGGLDGHTNPKVQWGFLGKDGTQQTYGGTIHVGTYCNSGLTAGECQPVSRMNLMFVR